MRLPLAMFIAALSWSAADADAGEWQQALPGYDVRVHSDSLHAAKDADGGKVVEFLATWDTPRPMPNQNGGTVKSIKAQATIFCERQRYGTYGLRGAGFSETGMRGEALFVDRDLGYQSIEPETPWYELRKRYCRSWWQKAVPDRLLQLLE